ncbi:hypothetical protein [Solitalea canadensis]|uniref:Uncharacterized protein n=1 Tax=Solitalea canadensis (strain ATCC 29591 / DSM 3403 / JCM 21819 / LMG 8368 / NBRC 15130 / NCIMB 12057 / USAM 9D) TaxID=929556 RepID=H8KPR2_SOLCM|nr:hypothetical protein [Solitalea canadensis]AFD05960.1 hypothetical protein Solca_0845 [Solitalea canadensis DSM 3403]
MNWIELVVGIFGGGTISSIFTAIFYQQKNKADARKASAEADGVVIENYQKFVIDLQKQREEDKKLSDERIKSLEDQLKDVLEREKEYLKQITLFLEERKSLSDRISYLEKENKILKEKIVKGFSDGEKH